MKKFNVLYADPPWSYKKKVGQGVANEQYNLMTIQDIQNLKVEEIAADDSILFLWVTFPLLQEGLDTMKKWGFTYKTLGFSWIKTNKVNGKPFFGIGSYTKSNCEVCLIGVKGKPLQFKKSNSISSVVLSQLEKHSKKPSVIREKIEELMPDVPKIELFARETAKGWVSLGNEIDGKDIRDALEELKK